MPVPRETFPIDPPNTGSDGGKTHGGGSHVGESNREPRVRSDSGNAPVERSRRDAVPRDLLLPMMMLSNPARLSLLTSGAVMTPIMHSDAFQKLEQRIESYSIADAHRKAIRLFTSKTVGSALVNGVRDVAAGLSGPVAAEAAEGLAKHAFKFGVGPLLTVVMSPVQGPKNGEDMLPPFNRLIPDGRRDGRPAWQRQGSPWPL